MARHRHRIERVSVGGVKNRYNRYTHQQQGRNSKTSEMYDHTTKGPPFVSPTNMDSRKCDIGPVRLSGTCLHNGHPIGDISNWVITKGGETDADAASNNPHRSYSWKYWETKALAGLNVTKPSVDPWLFLFELRELPRMLYQLGHILRRGPDGRNPADWVLATSFGWKPLLSDLSKLIDLVSDIEKTAATLKQGLEEKQFKRNISDEQISFTDSAGTYRFMVWSNAKINRNWSGNRKVWFTVNTVPKFEVPRFNSGTDYSQLARSIIDTSVKPSTIWNAIPWTWLFDYFVNVGTYLEATQGVLPWRYENMCIMCETNLTATYSLADSRNFQLESLQGQHTCNRKARRFYKNPTAGLSFKPNPIQGKLHILGSLYVSKLFK